MSIKFRVLSVLFLCTISACSQKKAKPTSLNQTQFSTLKLKAMDSVLNTFVDNKQLAGIQTAILDKDSLIHFNTYGFADIEAGKKLTDKSLFRIFSMTKPIVSVALMQLFEQGKFALQDPLHNYLPEFKNIMVYSDSLGLQKAKNAIKIIDLLRHSSGLGYGRGQYNFINEKYAEANLFASTNNKEYAKKVSQLPLSFEPGTDWEYGVSTNICGYLIEVLSGEPLDEYLKNHILEPLKMEHTYFQIPENEVKHFTVGYGLQNDSLYISEASKNNRYTQTVTLFNGGGGLVSTTNDYLKFCKMLLNSGSLNGIQILKPETISLMTKDHLKPVKKHTPRLRLLPGETGFGLGFSIASKTEVDDRGVYGWGGAVGTYFRIDPEKEIAYIMMIQISPYRQLRIRETFQQLVNDAFY